MIRHIVLWKLKDNARGFSRGEIAVELKRRLEGLKELIPDLLELKVGFEFRSPAPSYEVCLNTLFKNEQGLANYQGHPEHVKVADFVREVTSDRATVDYQTD